MHIGAKFIFRWGFSKPLLRIQRCIENKKCSPEKVSIFRKLQIDTLSTQNLELIYLELACSRTEHQKWVFWQMQKLRVPISKIKITYEKILHFFTFFVNFSTDSDIPAVKFFKNGTKHADIFV